MEQALETAALGVVVDLQQVEALVLEGIAVLVIGLELAAILGKSIVLYHADANGIDVTQKKRNFQKIPAPKKGWDFLKL